MKCEDTCRTLDDCSIPQIKFQAINTSTNESSKVAISSLFCLDPLSISSHIFFFLFFFFNISPIIIIKLCLVLNVLTPDY
ncbi:hypothetical protein HanHA300_Chr08g0289531 [Helianthus annuus]|nr:hypothetical protein HanHA300_Chr08g0289531 [Helianthus annuus]KAJ0554443.1 hypothetical protein HanHA89_Chr08g0307831 [Helianthus annuus]